MRHIRHLIVAIITVILLINCGIVAFAMDEGFSTESVSDEAANNALKSINLSVLETEPSRDSIECFDVSENGLIAIGNSNSTHKTVCVYSGDGDFQYGFSFESNGSFGVELRDRLFIYLVRSDLAIAVTPAGEVESVHTIQNTSENNSYWRNSVFSTERTVGDSEYFLKNDMGIFNVFASSYSQLISRSTDGEELIIYDVNTTQFTNTVIIVVFVILFVCIVAFVIARGFIKPKQK